jgi:UDP-N-acetylglucosamine 2-epimerase (non-hydrolysing)
MKILSVVGARPNFMKIAPFIKAIEEHNNSLSHPATEHVLVHTGQHYDVRMSEAFFHKLGIPDPEINLEVGSGTHAEQVGYTMIGLEKVLEQEKPDWVVVVGDVNATLAASVTAKKLNIKVCHIEAGLRSGDMTMPEEINRLVTDRLSNLLLTPDRISSENLLREGVAESNIIFVGNIMIDTLEQNRGTSALMNIDEILTDNLYTGIKTDHKPLDHHGYALMTLHRPSNVDKKEILEPIIRFLLDDVTQNHKLVWPVHPRTKKRLDDFGLWELLSADENVILLNPIGYHEMLRLNMSAAIMLTDSGGLQEECCVLGTPCLTLRWNTERPVTLREHGGASVLVGNNVERIRKEYRATLSQKTLPQRPELWDGHTAKRCLISILNYRESSTDQFRREPM